MKLSYTCEEGRKLTLNPRGLPGMAQGLHMVGLRKEHLGVGTSGL